MTKGSMLDVLLNNSIFVSMFRRHTSIRDLVYKHFYHKYSYDDIKLLYFRNKSGVDGTMSFDFDVYFYMHNHDEVICFPDVKSLLDNFDLDYFCSSIDDVASACCL